MIGILAFQGAFAKHARVFERLGEKTCFVKKPSDLLGCSGLVMPGGESTVIRLHLQRMEMVSPLQRFAEDFPIFGTCAGLILMSTDLEILDVGVVRNGFGPQIHSVRQPLDSDLFPGLEGVFIRAPRIQSCGKKVEVLASYHGEPVLVKQGNHLGATFHPELTDDVRIHQMFVAMATSGQLPTHHFLENTRTDHEGGSVLPPKIRTG